MLHRMVWSSGGQPIAYFSIIFFLWMAQVLMWQITASVLNPHVCPISEPNPPATLRERTFCPQPQGSEHFPQPLQSSALHFASHAWPLQLLTSASGGHFLPVPICGTKIVRFRIDVPVPHGCEHLVHASHAVTTQSEVAGRSGPRGSWVTLLLRSECPPLHGSLQRPTTLLAFPASAHDPFLQVAYLPVHDVH